MTEEEEGRPQSQKTKLCVRCLTHKKLKDFEKQTDGTYGRKSYCKVPCGQELAEEWANPSMRKRKAAKKAARKKAPRKKAAAKRPAKKKAAKKKAAKKKAARKR